MKFGTLSLAGRLTFLVTLSFVTILCVATLYLYVSMRKNVSRADSDFVSNEMAHLRTIISRYSNDSRLLVEEVREEAQWEASAKKSTMYFVRVLGKHGKILVETEHMENILPPARFPPPLDSKFGERRQWQSGHGRTFLLQSAWAGSGAHKRYLIQVGLDISHEETILLDYRKRMAIVLFAGVIISILICVLVVRTGMRPLDDIMKTVRRISAEQLHERIGLSPRGPKELTTLAVAFNGMLDRLEEAFGRLSRFSADIAHELRTPVNGLMGAAEVILSRDRTAEEYRQVIEAGMEEYSRLSRIIESLLFLARAENREIPIERCRFEVYNEMENIRELYDAVAEEAGVEVVCRGEAAVDAEPVLFQRALANLLANALRHTPRGGRVDLVAEKLPDGSVDISVSDTGFGIAPEHQPRIFDRFYRVDPARSLKTAGAGLGLAIVKSIMELHGGRATMRSEVGKGTTFTLRFPCLLRQACLK